MEAKNDEKGLAACYVRQKEALKHYIASRIDRPDEAEDLVQDVFERLWSHKDFIHPEAVLTLTYKTARNLITDRQRRYRKEDDVYGELLYTQESLQDTTEEKVSFLTKKDSFSGILLFQEEGKKDFSGLFSAYLYGINTILWHKSCIFVLFSQPNGKSFG